jgi:hypothetical protein
LVTRNVDYISNRTGSVYQRRNYATESVPGDIERKFYLLKYFEAYMAKALEHQTDWTFVDVARTRNMEFLVKYYRMKNAIVFKLSNGVIQVRLLLPRPLFFFLLPFPRRPS